MIAIGLLAACGLVGVLALYAIARVLWRDRAARRDHARRLAARHALIADAQRARAERLARGSAPIPRRPPTAPTELTAVIAKLEESVRFARVPTAPPPIPPARIPTGTVPPPVPQPRRAVPPPIPTVRR